MSIGSALAPVTLALDIGGSHLKAALLSASGAIIGEDVRCPTPAGGRPEEIIAALADLAGLLGAFDRVSVGFPGAIRGGVILSAPNLANAAWRGVELAERLGVLFGRPVRLANDATMQGLGAIMGQGIECILTFGTGMGFALFRGGVPAPQIELGRHPTYRQASYDAYVGNAALVQIGPAAWNRRVGKAIERVRDLVNYDRLYLGGGNGRLVSLKLPADVRIVSNQAGVTGGIRLWDEVVDAAFV